MNNRNRERFPTLHELLATAAAHAKQEEWSLRMAMDWVAVHAAQADAATGDVVQELLDVCDENEAEDRVRRHCPEFERYREGRNNG